MKLKMFVIVTALVASASLSQANITSCNLWDDGDGVITCIYTGQPDGNGGWLANITGDQNYNQTGDILGNISTDGTDPTLALSQTINNDTLLTWSDYHVQVTMGVNFTFTAYGVANVGWAPNTVVTQPAFNGTDWVGSIDYYAGNLVTPGNLLVFNYSVTFDSPSGIVSFAQQMTPSVVPEPGTMALAVVGGLLMAGWTVKRRQG